MIYNRYKGLRSLIQRGRFGRKVMYAALKPKVKKKAHICATQKVLFSQVEIETVNRCNGTCPFCPANALSDTRVRTVMEEDLFRHIVDQLAEMDYSGHIGLFSNNEPFLDKDIIPRSKYLREKLPHAFIHMFTNGTLLTPENVTEIIPYLDRMIIDNYNDDLVLNPPVVKIQELIEAHPELDEKIHIHLRKQNEVLYTRGGQAPNNEKKKVFNMPCLLPSEQFIIRPDGLVSLCSNDAMGVYTMGDCKSESLLDIWYGEKFTDMRKKLEHSREGLTLCEYCDTFSP